MPTFLSGVTDWQFLNEPLWRWALFFGAMMGIAFAWHGVIDLMK
jgi:hypothetical protein